MPASASLSIAAVADQVGELGLPDPVELAPGLREVLAGVVDPRKRRGVRHGLVVVLSAAVCAVVAGARSFVAVAEWVADVPGEVAAALGTERRCPSESTIRRVLGKVDPDRFDAAIGAFVRRLCVGTALARRRRVLAVDGKTLRGSRHQQRGGRDPIDHAPAARGRHHGAVTISNASAVIRSLDGIELSATVLIPERPAAGVVLVHGGGVTREEAGFFGRLADGLAAAGVASVRFDLRG